jgi:hypothetical protein
MTSRKIAPVQAAKQMPENGDLMPKLGYCWWWSKASGAWFLCDAGHMIDLYPYWLPYGELPDPSVNQEGVFDFRLRSFGWTFGDKEWVWDEQQYCWLPSDRGTRAFYALESFDQIDLRGEQEVSR